MQNRVFPFSNFFYHFLILQTFSNNKPISNHLSVVALLTPIYGQKERKIGQKRDGETTTSPRPPPITLPPFLDCGNVS